ncbi:MAG: hypothetical protein LKJ47_06170 [Bifidobacteriaceae bacterium]|jgi:uncharacterized membrane protein|nr:hypothetical protein [Bifidobacteriaceae bacterium]
MPLIAILLDAIALGGYFVQDGNRTHSIFVAGFVVEVVITVLLLVMTFACRGPHRQQHDYNLKGWRYMTLRYAIIIFSLVVNAVLLFLYFLNLKNGGSAVLFR